MSQLDFARGARLQKVLNHEKLATRKTVSNLGMSISKLGMVRRRNCRASSELVQIHEETLRGKYRSERNPPQQTLFFGDLPAAFAPHRRAPQNPPWFGRNPVARGTSGLKPLRRCLPRTRSGSEVAWVITAL